MAEDGAVPRPVARRVQWVLLIAVSSMAAVGVAVPLAVGDQPAASQIDA